MSSNELLNLLNKQWASAQDIYNIGCVGINKAYEIKKGDSYRIKELDNYKEQ